MERADQNDLFTLQFLSAFERWLAKFHFANSPLKEEDEFFIS